VSVDCVAIYTYHADVAELVRSSDGVIIQETRRRDPALVCVVGKHYQLVLRTLVAHKVETVLAVGHHNAVAHRVD